MSSVRPKVLHGVTERIETPRGRIYVTVNKDENGKIYEVFVDSYDSEAKALCRVIALALQNNVDVDELIECLWKVETKEAVFDNGVLIRSLAQAVALAIGRAAYGPEYNGPYAERVKMLKEAKKTEKKEVPEEKTVSFGGVCPECGGTLIFQEGCRTCLNCGYSKCG